MTDFTSLLPADPNRKIDPSVRSDIAAKRAGYTFVRLTANSWNDTNNGSMKEIALGGDPVNGAIKPMVALVHKSSSGIVTFRFNREAVDRNW